MFRSILILLLGCIVLPTVLLAKPAKDSVATSEFVMILSSYSYEEEWGTVLAKEIRNRLEKGRPELKVNVTYAGIAAHSSFLADRFAMQGAFGRGRLSKRISKPNVLILIGDESWMLYRVMDLRGIWEKIPVVICGTYAEVLNNYAQFFPDKQFSDTSFISLKASASALRTTAVVEPDNTKQTIKLARTLVPDLRRLYYLSNGSYVDSYMREKLSLHSKQLNIPFTEIQVKRSNADSVKQVLAALPLDVVVVTNGVSVPTNTRVPVLTLRDVAFHAFAPLGGYFAPISAFAEKTSQAVFHILETGEVNDIPFTVAPDTAFYLNQTALMNAGLRSEAKALTNVVDRNVPPPFFIRNIRTIAIVLMIVIVIVFATFRAIYARRYRHNLSASLMRYRTLYDEYQVVYENMPVGLMLFDTSGKLLKRNAETDIFFEQFIHARADHFQLFDLDIWDEHTQEALFQRELVSRLLYFQDYCYRIQCCIIVDEETGDNQILVVVVDNTEIDKERKAKEQIYNVLNFAMNNAALGVAEYNLVDGLGFATEAWYDTLDIEHGVTDFSGIRHGLVPADKEKLNAYLEQVRNGASHSFLDNLQIQTRAGESHYIRIFIQPLECDQEKKRIIIAEMVLNVDEQVAREHNLELAVRKVQEADRLKNAFVANMRDEIRVPLQEILSCARELVATTDLEQRSKLNARIETGNYRMLELLNEIIEVSKVELNE